LKTISAGVGGPVVAENAIPSSGGPKFYKGKVELAATAETAQWFDALMTK
jgi:hypothetical protein